VQTGAGPSNALGHVGSFAHCGLGGTRTLQPASVHVATDEQSPVAKSAYSHPSDASVTDTHALPCAGNVAGHTKQPTASTTMSLAASAVLEASGDTSSAPQPHDSRRMTRRT